MHEPIVLDSDLSRRIISMLEGPQVEITDWQDRLSRLEDEYGSEIYRHLFYVVGHLDFRPKEAKTRWSEARGAWVELSEQLRKPIDVRLAVLSYLLERRQELRNPAVVEIELLKKAEEFATRDDLTQLHNYRYFRERIEREAERVHRHGGVLSLLMVDVDDFKRYNDELGHQKGNKALQALASVFTRTTRAVDVVSRYGGEEFAILLPSTLRAGALVAAGKIRAAVAGAGIPRGKDAKEPLTVSIGVASLPGDARSAEELVARADEALYAAKRAGKNCVRCCSGNRRESPRYEARLEGSLRLLGNVKLPIVTFDLSQGGLSFEIDERVTEEDVVHLELALPESGRELECTCRVVRVQRAGKAYRVGARIIHLEGQSGYQLRRLLEGLDTVLPESA